MQNLILNLLKNIKSDNAMNEKRHKQEQESNYLK
jgi:hypothetical protein